MNKCFRYIYIAIVISTFLACKEKGISIVGLHCDYMENPLGVDKQNPFLQWQLLSGENGKSQSAYRIIVSSDLSLLEKDQGDYWDSNKTASSETVIKYQGKSLPATEELYWKVMVWDEKDHPSDWSDAASWTMGLLDPSDWKAKWIGEREDIYPDSAITFPAPYFRKEFAIAKPIKKAMAYVSGLGFYEMYFNGDKIGDLVLAPAVTNYDKRSLKKLLYHYDDQSTQRVFYNVFDVTQNLKAQNNAVGMILGNGWYNQRDRTVEGNMWYDLPKLIFQLEIEFEDGTKEVVVSDDSWKITTGPLLHNAIFTGEVYDARRELGAWNKAEYNDTAWKPVLQVRPPTGELRTQSIPYNRVMQIVDTQFEQVNDSIYRFTLPETVSGWSAIKVKGKPGDTVKLRFISEEELDYGQTDTYILKGNGEEEWEPKFTWHTFRIVEVLSGQAEITKHSLTVKSIYTDVANTGSFECSNELFNRIAQAFNRTMHANFKGIVSSDPHRERLAYTGDGQVITESLLYSYDMTRFLRKFVEDMDDARNKKTGYVPHTAPFSGGGGGPAWGSAYVIVPWNYYCHYGDKTILQEHYDGMKHWVEYLGTRTDEKGLIVREEPNGWCLGEWCTLYNSIEIPTSLVNTAYYYYVTRIMADVAKALSQDADAASFQSLAETIKENFNSAFYDPLTNHYWQGKQGSDVFALGLGLVPDDKYEKVFAAMLNHLHSLNYHFDTGIFATPLLLKVLSDNGKVDMAYKLMDQRDFPGYSYLLDSKNSTLWETWDGGGDPGGCGHCHPMFGSVVAWFYNSLGGIKPDTSNPGMKHFYVEPRAATDLKYCKASYMSLYGEIISDWKIDKDGNFSLKVTVPTNTSATIVLPKWGADSEEKSVTVQSGVHSFTISE